MVGPDEAIQIQTQEVLHDSTNYTAIRCRIQTIDFPYSDTFFVDQMWVWIFAQIILIRFMIDKLRGSKSCVHLENWRWHQGFSSFHELFMSANPRRLFEKNPDNTTPRVRSARTSSRMSRDWHVTVTLHSRDVHVTASDSPVNGTQNTERVLPEPLALFSFYLVPSLLFLVHFLSLSISHSPFSRVLRDSKIR